VNRFRLALALLPLAVILTQINVMAKPAAEMSQDPSLETAGEPYAPLDVTKRPGQDPRHPLSSSQRQELLGEFKGLVHMGLRESTYEAWEGKKIADCDASQNPRDRWSYRCEILTGQGSGLYYFYPNESRHVATLQNLDIRVDASAEKLLDDFRQPVQALFGQASFVPTPTVRARTTGVIRHWNSGSDVAELFIDHSVRPEGSVRFVWLRSPLVGGAHAEGPKKTPDVQ